MTVRTIRKLPKPSPLQTIIDMSEESLLSDQQEACVSEHQLQALVDVGLAQSVSKQYSMVLQRERRQSEVRELQVKFLHNYNYVREQNPFLNTV